MSAAAVATAADYGLENRVAVRHMFSRGAWTIAFGIAMYLINYHDYPAPASHILIALGLIGASFIAAGVLMLQASRGERFQARDRVLDTLALTGEERVLDVGCGTGLMLIGVAKKLKAGRVTGLDMTGEGDIAKENAKFEGVADKVRIDSLETPKFVYPDNHYDVVVSELALRNAGESDVRQELVREMFRVLKPGGRLAIYDVLYTGDYAETLRAAGAKSVDLSPVNWSWGLPARAVAARK